MIKESDLLWIRKWFEIYTQEYCIGKEKFDSCICLKVVHTKKVVEEILDIGNSLNLKREECYLAEITAILHDIGRFVQYARYHSFSDANTENHAELGIEVIRKTGVINRFEIQDRQLIEFAVSHHNKATLPETDNSKSLFFLKLLRDADKIDILRVVTDHYSGCHMNSAIEMGIPDVSRISKAAIKSIIENKVIKAENVKSINDFKLLQMSWVFDLNFQKSFEIINERKYLDRIAVSLPNTNSVKQVVSIVKERLMQNCANERSIKNA